MTVRDWGSVQAMRARKDMRCWLTPVSSWSKLHYIDAKWPEKDFLATSWCGVTTTFALPGVISRLGMPRCRRCCSLLGVPQGKGSLPNELARAQNALAGKKQP